MASRVRRLLFAVAASLLSTSAAAQVRLQPFAAGFNMPVGFVQDPVDTSIHYVVEQSGRIRAVRTDGMILTPDFLNLSAAISCCGERGLLGLAFAPDYAVSHRFYVNFTNPDGHTVVARFKRSAGNPLVADASTRFDLKWRSLGNLPYIPHVPAFGNHNGGDLMFGPDGYLYMGMGDGGSGDDPFNRAQSADTLLGKMLRIDVSVADTDPNGYRVPADNPFAGATPPIAALPEIWDFGMRNPFRFAFDIGPDGTGALIIADVGQNNREEIDYEPPGRGGRNYGWSIREGTRPNNTGFAAAFTPLTDPIYEYTHADGFVITGGFTYRGTALDPSLRGRYFFTDFGTARLWSIGLVVNPVTGAASVTNVIEHTAEVGGPALVGAVSSFGRDADGELYLVQYGGTIQKLVAPPDPPRVFFTADFNGDGRPDLLTQTVSGKVTVASSAPLSANFFNAIRVLWGDRTPWKVVGVADMDGDGAPDIIWQGPTGSIVYWFLVGAGVREIFTLYDGASLWRVAAVADIDHDGDADLIWQGPTGRVVVWELQGQGRTVTRARDLWGEASAWRIAGTADIDGDGDQDLLWQGPGGSIVVWTMAGGAVSSASYVFADKTPWTLIGVGDLNGDGQADFLWLSPTGQAGAWMMTGKLVLQFMYLNVIGAGPIWEISIAPNT